MDNHKGSDLLITHFHYDHISGLTYMLDKGVIGPVFNNVFLPNIWDFPFVVAAILTEEMLVDSELDPFAVPSFSYNKHIGLLTLLRMLCASTRQIHFLKRGDTFKGEYVTLLPDDSILKDIQNKFDAIGMPTDILTRLNSLSERVCAIITEAAEVENLYENSQQILVAISGCMEEFESIVIDANDQNKGWLTRDNKIKLNKFGNRISLVFQNVQGIGDNLLFTGDAEVEDLTRIIPIKGGLTELHGQYKYLKLPHHGSESHFVNFSAFAPEYVLIPSGMTTSFNGTYPMIYDGYRYLGKEKLCSNSNFCRISCGTSCKYGMGCALVNNVVYPELYAEV